MTGLSIFAFVVLPIIVVAMGYGVMRLNQRDAAARPGK